MISPTEAGRLIIMGEVGSTQDVAGEYLLGDPEKIPGVILARHQTDGRGRFGREWKSTADQSLTMSMIFSKYADHKQPWLVGMAVSIALARAVGCQIRWPNDVVFEGLKVGGILTELLPDKAGRKVPVIGMGVNLNQTVFPKEIEQTATSLFIATGQTYSAQQLAESVFEAFAAVPEPESWAAIEEAWSERDATPGKMFKLSSGEIGEATGVGPAGELVCTVDGAERTVFAAESILGD